MNAQVHGRMGTDIPTSWVHTLSHVEVGVMTSTVLLALDFLEAVLPTELPSVLGRLLLCDDDWQSPVSSGGLGAVEAAVLIGGGTEVFVRARDCSCGTVVYNSVSIACTCLP